MTTYQKILYFTTSIVLALAGIYIMANGIFFTKDISQLINGFLIIIFSGISILNFTQNIKDHKRKSKKND